MMMRGGLRVLHARGMHVGDIGTMTWMRSPGFLSSAVAITQALAPFSSCMPNEVGVFFKLPFHVENGSPRCYGTPAGNVGEWVHKMALVNIGNVRFVAAFPLLEFCHLATIASRLLCFCANVAVRIQFAHFARMCCPFSGFRVHGNAALASGFELFH
jgi:hypothetical protein